MEVFTSLLLQLEMLNRPTTMVHINVPVNLILFILETLISHGL